MVHKPVWKIISESCHRHHILIVEGATLRTMGIPLSSPLLVVFVILAHLSIHRAFLSTKSSKLSINLHAATANAKGIQQTNKNESTTNGRLPLPFMELSSLGLSGRWQEKAGNFILKPKSSSSKPLGVIHFLGGN